LPLLAYGGLVTDEEDSQSPRWADVDAGAARLHHVSAGGVVQPWALVARKAVVLTVLMGVPEMTPAVESSPAGRAPLLIVHV
jgi:hypothetical protein